MKENTNSEGSNQPYKCQCNKCGKIFISTDIQVVKYQEYPGASFVEDYTSPCCNAYFDEVDDQDRDIDQVESGLSSIRDNLTRLVLIKKQKGLLHSTNHPPRRPAATNKSMAGLQPAHPEVLGL